MKEHLVAREAPAADEGEAERGEAVECRQLGVWPPGRDVEQDGHAHRHAHAERRGAREKPGCEEKPADQLRQRGERGEEGRDGKPHGHHVPDERPRRAAGEVRRTLHRFASRG